MDGSHCKILGPGPAGPRIDVHPTPYVATDRHVSQDSLFSVTVLLSSSECPPRDSLSVTDSGSHSGTPFEAPFVDFFRDKIYTEFSSVTSQRK